MNDNDSINARMPSMVSSLCKFYKIKVKISDTKLKGFSIKVSYYFSVRNTEIDLLMRQK